MLIVQSHEWHMAAASMILKCSLATQLQHLDTIRTVIAQQGDRFATSTVNRSAAWWYIFSSVRLRVCLRICL